MNLLGVFDCFGVVLCRRMVSLSHKIDGESGVVVVEDEDSGGGDMGSHGHIEN